MQTYLTPFLCQPPEKMLVKSERTENQMFKINIHSEDYPSFAEAQKASKEADIVMKQYLDVFLSKPVRHVFFELECRDELKNSPFLMFAAVFNYGYILGKRSERARRKSKKEPAPSANGTSSEVSSDDTNNYSQLNNSTDPEKCQDGICAKISVESGEV